MDTKKAILHLHSPLCRHWLALSLQPLGWESADQDTPEAVHIVQIAGPDDEARLMDVMESGQPVVAYSQLPVSKLLNILYTCEISGLIHAGMEVGGLKETMEAAARSEEYFDGTTIAYILSDKYREIHERVSSLSRRELEIVEGILEDLTNDEIAERFGLSVRTVNAHKRNILQKMRERSLVGVIKTVLTYSLRFG